MSCIRIPSRSPADSSGARPCPAASQWRYLSPSTKKTGQTYCLPREMSLMTVALLWPSYFDRKGSALRTRGDIIHMTPAYFIPSAKVRTKSDSQPPAGILTTFCDFPAIPTMAAFCEPLLSAISYVGGHLLESAATPTTRHKNPSASRVPFQGEPKRPFACGGTDPVGGATSRAWAGCCRGSGLTGSPS